MKSILSTILYRITLSGLLFGLGGLPPSPLGLLKPGNCVQSSMVHLMADVTPQALSEILLKSQQGFLRAHMIESGLHTFTTYTSFVMAKVIISLFTPLGGITAPFPRM